MFASTRDAMEDSGSLGRSTAGATPLSAANTEVPMQSTHAATAAAEHKRLSGERILIPFQQKEGKSGRATRAGGRLVQTGLQHYLRFVPHAVADGRDAKEMRCVSCTCALQL